MEIKHSESHHPGNPCRPSCIGYEATQKAKKEQRNKNRRERDQALRDLGLKKVRGALGGVYWE